MGVKAFDVALTRDPEIEGRLAAMVKRAGLGGWDIRVYYLPHSLPGRHASSDIDVPTRRASIWVGRGSWNRAGVVEHEVAHVLMEAKGVDAGQDEEKAADMVGGLLEERGE